MATDAVPLTRVSDAAPAAPVTRRGRWPIVAAAVVLLLVAGSWFAWREINVRRASAQLDRAVALTEEGRLFEAYDLATSVEPLLAGNATLAGLLPAVSDTLTVTSDPPGAEVYLTRFVAGVDEPRALVGRTPLTNVRVARGDYVMTAGEGGLRALRAIDLRPRRDARHRQDGEAADIRGAAAPG